MANTDTRNIPATVQQIKRLEEAGCEIVRVAVPDMQAAEAFSEIKKAITIPLVADIHFDYRLALAAIKNGADKLRLNPGNIGSASQIKQVAAAAKTAGIPIRVGVNGGSLAQTIYEKYNGLTAEGLAESAFKQIQILEDCDFDNIVVSVKVSDVPLLIKTHILLAEKCKYPLHIGLTEAGTAYRGALRSAAGLGALLHMGIGDTVRVSLNADPIEEIKCAKEILQTMGLRTFGARVITCPCCGRTEIDLTTLANNIEAYCENIKTPLTVAVMGCVVNGPGEVREADIGVAGGKNAGVIFSKGKIIGKFPESELEAALIREINRLAQQP